MFFACAGERIRAFAALRTRRETGFRAMNFSDTIVALSSATGAGARMIVRLSGPLAPRMARELTSAPVDPEASATFTCLRFAGLVVPAWLYVFRAPRSYTCEDLVELHVPGNAVLARLLLDHLRGSGARDAQPGEFTARAFFNGRLDLAEAEGVAATIGASSENELAAARQLMAGGGSGGGPAGAAPPRPPPPPRGGGRGAPPHHAADL